MARWEGIEQPIKSDGRVAAVPGGRAEAYVPTPYAVNHAAALLELANGDLLLVWFAGMTEEGRRDISIVMSRLNAGSDRWTQPEKISRDEEKSEQNPLLFQAPDGKLLLLHTAQKAAEMSRREFERLYPGQVFTRQETAEIRCLVSEDNGMTWGPSRTMFGKPGSFCRAPIAVLENGDWIFPMWYSLSDGRTSYGSDYSVVQISNDKGEAWTEYPIPGSKGRVHASIVELGGGSLIALFRSRSADNIYISRSADYGRTWTEPTRTALPNNNASIRAIRLASGRIAVIYNHQRANDDPDLTVWPRERAPITLAISEDGGLTWPYARNLDLGDGFIGEANSRFNRRYHYPWIVQTKDGLIHAAYTYAGGAGIKHVVLSEDWILGTALQS
ncbi:sialidase family protein [Cohnella cellulosilytica]|uniref:Exo-alpha-sialidase n=1 Tax=Cohnella cellulosilytica TaxID=986710 RepID=A0ABW2FAB5_9BACL